MAAWYDSIKKQYLVKAEFGESTNTFPREPVLRFEIVGGERVPKINPKTGKQKEDDVYIDRDVYIECTKKNKIFCLTSEISKKEAKKLYGGDLYLACIFQYGTGMNMLRKYYMDYVGELEDICSTEVVSDKNGEPKKTNTWNDEIMLDGIESKGGLRDIELLDGEIYFKSTNLQLLCEMLNAKKTRNVTPFSDDYLVWDMYTIPEDELKQYESILHVIKVSKGIDKTNDKKEKRTISLKSGQDIKKLNNIFIDQLETKLSTKNNEVKLSKLKYSERIRGSKEIIHKLGKWDEYIRFLNENI